MALENDDLEAEIEALEQDIEDVEIDENDEDQEADSIEEDEEAEEADVEPEEEADPDAGLTLEIEGDEQAKADDEETAPQWVKDLRKEHRELKRKVREYEKQQEKAVEAKAPTLPTKPTLESCDYDQDEFERKTDEFYQAKLKVDAYNREQEAKEKAQQDEWNSRLSQYNERKQKLADKLGYDADEAEEAVRDALDQTQIGILVHGHSDPAYLFALLHKNPSQLNKLAAIKDPIKLAFAAAEIRPKGATEMAKKPPAPEKRINAGGGVVTGSSNSALARAKDKADKSGDYSEYFALKRKLLASKN